MALIECPECGHKLSEKANVCPLCGGPIERKNNTSPNSQPFIKRTIPCEYNNIILTTTKSYLRKYLFVSIGYILITLGCVLFQFMLSRELYIMLQTVIFAYSSILFILFVIWEYNVCNNLFAVNTFFPYYSSDIWFAWLLPVVHFYKPYAILKFVWREIDPTNEKHSRAFHRLWWFPEVLSMLAIYACIVFEVIGLKSLVPYGLLVFNLSSMLALISRIRILYRYRKKEKQWIRAHRHTPYLTFI